MKHFQISNHWMIGRWPLNWRYPWRKVHAQRPKFWRWRLSLSVSELPHCCTCHPGVCQRFFSVCFEVNESRALPIMQTIANLVFMLVPIRMSAEASLIFSCDCHTSSFLRSLEGRERRFDWKPLEISATQSVLRFTQSHEAQQGIPHRSGFMPSKAIEWSVSA